MQDGGDDDSYGIYLIWITRAMLSKGAIPLGDFFILQHHDTDTGLFQGSLPASITSTMVGCAYNTYVTGTDLVFRPYTRQLRIRALVNEDLDNYGLKGMDGARNLG